MQTQIVVEEQAINEVQIGLASFKVKTKKDPILDIIKEQYVCLMLNKNKTQINFEEKISQTNQKIYLLWIALFKHMTQFKINEISLFYFSLLTIKQQNPLSISLAQTILKSIKNIKLSQLLYLKINKTFVANIEILTLLNCQKLEELYIQTNYVSRFNSFVKWSNKNLQKFHIYENPIRSIQSLTKILFKDKNIKDLTLQYYYGKVVCEDLSILMKLDVQNIEQLEIMVKNRIFNQKIDKMIKKRFPKIKDFYKGKQ